MGREQPLDGARNVVAAVGVTADDACEQLRQCQRVSARPLWALWPIYERRAVAAAAQLIYRRPSRLHRRGTRCRRPNKAHSHATEPNARERSRLVPVFKSNAHFSFLYPRYFTSGNTIRHCPSSFCSFRVLFYPDPLLFTCQFL